METFGPQRRPRILLVDDEPSLLKMMSVYLGRLGYSIETCGSTQEAVALIQSEPDGFVVAVLDASMTGVGLEQVARRMIEANPALRVLAASGYPVDMTTLEAAAPRRVAFLHKPFTPEMLATAIRRMLAAEKEEL